MSTSESEMRQARRYGKRKRLKTLIYVILGLLCWGVFVALAHPKPFSDYWFFRVVFGFGAIWFVSLGVLTHKSDLTRMGGPVEELDS